DRLIHGQVVTAWIRAIGRCDEILVCDDNTRKNTFLQQVLTMTAPPDIPLRILSEEETIKDFQEKANDPRRVLLLTRTPEPMLRLVTGGVPIDSLILGGMGAGPGRKPLHKWVSASDEELSALRQIQAKGVKVELKMVPGDRAIDLASIERR
ncbi:MAG: PTS sugar transporter subunit IIB, partial [Chloroflexi bacterium]|nr:PTS sugar transporter subunit IIB [Chloroflexota bacterium]